MASEKLHDENRALRQQMDAFVTQARQNERKLRRFRGLELRMIGVESLNELLYLMLYPDRSRFKWDVVSLILLDPEYEIQRILEEDGVDVGEFPNLLFVTERSDLETLYPASMFSMLAPYNPRRHSALFPNKQRAPGSVVLLPLVRHGRLIGSYNIGSLASDRFVRGARTDFFEHLSATAAICLENAVNLERLKRQGLTDTLTDVNNRRFFDQRLLEEVAAAKRNREPLSCLLLDIDHFKQVNDRFGHQAGDRVLRDVAAVIKAQLRGSDVLARYGGEEFAALLPLTAAPEAQEVAERVRIAVAALEFDEGQTFAVTISIGVATFDPLADENAARMRGDFLVGQADNSLYRCKEQGRNRVIAAGAVTVPLLDEPGDA